MENGMLDIEFVQQQMAMEKRRDVLKCHEFKVWQGTNGYWYTYLPKQPKGRVQIKKKTKEEIEDCIYEHYQENNKHSFKNIIDEWIESKLNFGEIEKQTYDRYKTDIDRFFKGTWIIKKDISEINEYELEEFIKLTIRDMNLSAKAYGGMRTIIRGAFKYAYRRRLTDISIENFFGNIDLPSKIFKKKEVKSQVFTDEEIRKLEDWVWKHDKSVANLAILLGIYTGLRAGEIVALTQNDIDFDCCTLNIDKTEIKYRNENGKYEYQIRQNAKTEAGNRKVVFNEKAKDVLEQIINLNPNGEYLIQSNVGRIKEQNLTHKLYSICKTLGIERKCMHKLRKTYCTKMLNANVSEAFIISQMGHTDIATSKSYYYYNNYDNDTAKQVVAETIIY